VTDYRMTFPTTALAAGVAGINVLVAELKSDGGNVINALGDPRDAAGNIVVFVPSDDPAHPTPQPEVWYGRPGSAASSYTDPGGKVVQVPARGDPALYYVHIRSGDLASAFVPSRHGLKDANAVDSAAVLGIWAGDTPP
jgi:hypothetical protein